MHLVALTHVDNRLQTVVLWQDVVNHSMARQVALVPRPLALVAKQAALLRWQLASVRWQLASVQR